MRPGAAIKSDARGCLRTHWGQAAGVFFVFAGVYLLRTAAEEVLRLAAGVPMELGLTADPQAFFGGLPDTLSFLNARSLLITLLFLILGILIFSPVNLGVTRYFWKLSGDKPEGVGCVFDFFASSRLYFRSVALTVRVGARVLLCAFGLFLPAAVLLLLNGGALAGVIGWTPDEYTASLLSAAAVLWSLCAAFLLLLFWQRYFLAAYFAAEDDELEIGDALGFSAAWMHGHKLRAIGFCLSFFGWALLCLLVLPVLYVYPYINQSLACFARAVVIEHHRLKSLAEEDEGRKAEDRD